MNECVNCWVSRELLSLRNQSQEPLSQYKFALSHDLVAAKGRVCEGVRVCLCICVLFS